VGRIIKVEGEMAEVIIKRHTACEKCGGCNLGTDKGNTVRAKNSIKAQVGDKVYINMENIGVLKAAAIMYILPLVAMIIGFTFFYYGAEFFGNVDAREVWGILFGFAFLIGSFLIIRKFEPKFAQNALYHPEITGFASEDE
jgi:sigma-E factor negative regulatory protein RseC